MRPARLFCATRRINAGCAYLSLLFAAVLCVYFCAWFSFQSWKRRAGSSSCSGWVSNYSLQRTAKGSRWSQTLGIKMALEQIIGGGLAVIFIIFLVARFFPKATPKETHFRCWRCGTSCRHHERTIEAWRNKKTKFFCQSCHRKWLESQPIKVQNQHSLSGGRAPSGCLGVALLLFIAPLLVGYVVFRMYA